MTGITRTILFAALATPLALAQTALTGGIQGIVTDVNGGVIAGAPVALSSESLAVKQQTAADNGGRFLFLRLAPAADYKIIISAPGFAPWERSALRVLSGESASLNAVLAVGTQRERVDVTESAIAIITETTEVSQSVDRQRLTTLPANGRLLHRFALLDPHVRNSSGLGADGFGNTRLSINGATFRATQYRLDGNTNYDTLFNNAPLQRLSLSAVQEFRVLTSQFNAEHGSTSTGLIITTTKSGTDELHGEAFFFVRPSGIQARPPLASFQIPNELTQGGAAAGGPLVMGRTYFFANYERLNQNRGSFISSPAPAFYLGEYRDNLALARFDHRFTDTHWTSLRVNGQRETNTNPADRVGGLLQPSTANRTAGQSIGSQLTDSMVFGPVVNEFRAGYTNAVPSNTVPLSPQVGVARAGYSTEGASSFSFVRTEVYQLADQLSYQRGTHTFKFGGDFIRRKVRDFSYDQFGTYTFPAGAPVAGQAPIQYRQRFGVSRISYGQTQWAGFMQDSWRAAPRLTLNLGLRYDYQSVLDDNNNLGPRVGFSWDVFGNAGMVVRGGFGLYYDQPFFHGLTQRYILEGVNSPFATYTLVPGQAGFPAFPSSLTPSAAPTGLALAPRNVAIRGPELLAPYTTHFTFGIQKQAGEWALSADVIRSLTVKQILDYNLNAPAPFPRTRPGQLRSVAEADRTRPFFDPALGYSIFQGIPVRDVKQSANGGSAFYNALDLGITRRFSRRYQMEAHYVLSSALNNVTDDHLGANPNEWSDVGRAERGMGDFSQRHRFVGHGLVFLPWNTQFSAVVTLASGLPVNTLTGIDNNGDTTLVDRPATFGRNAFRGSSQKNFDVSLAKSVALGEAARIELRGDIFNLFNNQNYYVFNNVYGDAATPRSTFLRPVGGIANVDPARQFTFGLRLVF